ncbi:MAG TPA: hypothetical protein VGH51_01065 [Candidatus Angelobacter sp.]
MQKMKILVAEDDLPTLRLLEKLLTDWATMLLSRMTARARARFCSVAGSICACSIGKCRR